MTNEKDREEVDKKAFRAVLKTLFWYSGFGYMPAMDDDDYLNDCMRIVQQSRAEAVKAERERCAERADHEVAGWLVGCQRMALRASILSDDQEAPKEDEPGREETLQEYLDRQDGADIDLEHGSN